jgi:hypothetical protein
MPLSNAPIIKEVAGLAIVAGVPADIWTPAAGKKIRVCGYRLGVSAATSVLFKEGVGGAAAFGSGIRTPLIGANLSDGGDIAFGQGMLATTADDHLKLDVSASATVHGYVWGYEE